MGQAKLRGTREQRVAQAKKLTTRLAKAVPSRARNVGGSMMMGFGLLASPRICKKPW